MSKTVLIIIGVIIAILIVIFIFRSSMSSGAVAPTMPDTSFLSNSGEYFGDSIDVKDVDCIEDPVYAPCSAPHRGYFWPNDYLGNYSGAANYTDDGTYITYATLGGN
jgi:hypothetical protein